MIYPLIHKKIEFFFSVAVLYIKNYGFLLTGWSLSFAMLRHNKPVCYDASDTVAYDMVELVLVIMVAVVTGMGLLHCEKCLIFETFHNMKSISRFHVRCRLLDEINRLFGALNMFDRVGCVGDLPYVNIFHYIITKEDLSNDFSGVYGILKDKGVHSRLQKRSTDLLDYLGKRLSELNIAQHRNFWRLLRVINYPSDMMLNLVDQENDDAVEVQPETNEEFVSFILFLSDLATHVNSKWCFPHICEEQWIPKDGVRVLVTWTHNDVTGLAGDLFDFTCAVTKKLEKKPSTSVCEIVFEGKPPQDVTQMNCVLTDMADIEQFMMEIMPRRHQ